MRGELVSPSDSRRHPHNSRISAGVDVIRTNCSMLPTHVISAARAIVKQKATRQFRYNSWHAVDLAITVVTVQKLYACLGL